MRWDLHLENSKKKIKRKEKFIWNKQSSCYSYNETHKGKKINQRLINYLINIFPNYQYNQYFIKGNWYPYIYSISKLNLWWRNRKQKRQKLQGKKKP
jgi:hypothetical protein